MLAALALCTALAICAAAPAAPGRAVAAGRARDPGRAQALGRAQAAATTSTTSATIAPSLSPYRLGAKGALTVTISYAGGELGLPSPVRRSVLRFPAGLTLEIPKLHSCAPARLQARGARGCPPQSLIGHGHALVEGHLGSQTITEDVALSAFLGPPQNLQPTFEILAEGTTPIGEQVVFGGTMLPDRAPYGEELTMSIPPIQTLPDWPDASIVNFSLTVGASARHRRRDANNVIVPSRCPAGGFPFAAEFTYADGSSGSTLATVPCPRSERSKVKHTAPGGGRAAGQPARAGAAIRPARAARTISLNESGRLHLTSKQGFTLNEQGSASGTIRGTIYVHLTIVSTSCVTAEVSIYTNGGSISGYATANYRRGSTTANFSGSTSIARGTGSYAHAHGSALSFSGTIARSSDAITVHVGGRLSD
jgi:hypothetical protein